MSESVFTGSLVLATMTMGNTAIIATGSKSFCGS